MMKDLNERVLWDYIDGMLSSEDKSRIDRLRESDKSLNARIESLKKFNDLLSVNIELKDCPSINVKANVLKRLSYDGTVVRKFFKYDEIWIRVFFVAAFLSVICLILLIVINPLQSLNDHVATYVRANDFNIIISLCSIIGVFSGSLIAKLIQLKNNKAFLIGN